MVSMVNIIPDQHPHVSIVTVTMLTLALELLKSEGVRAVSVAEDS